MYNIKYVNKKNLKKELKRTKFSFLAWMNKIFKSFKTWLKTKILAKIDDIYYKTYSNREKISKIILYIFAFISLVDITTGIILIVIKENSTLCWLLLVILWLFYAVAYLFLKFYHTFFGAIKVYEYDYNLTINYIINKLPHIAKVYGKTGAGKDSLTVGCASILANNMRSKLVNELEELKRILYIFDFNVVDNFISNNYGLFSSFSYQINQYNLLVSLKKYYGFIKSIYRNKISYNKLIQAYLVQLENPTEKITKYSFYDGINYHAYYDLLLEYILKYMRVYIEGNFIMANQPVVEDSSLGLMAKKFSMNFLQIKEMSVAYKGKVYNSKMLFPWKNHMIILETEAGSWYFNRDKENSKVLYESGVRDFKAYNRHFIEDLYWFMNDQDALRVDKLLRELDHSYIQVLEKNVIDGGIKRVTFYSFLLKHVESKIFKLENKGIKRNNKLNIYKKRKSIYNELNNIKKIKKYENKIKNFKIISNKNKIDKLYNKAKTYKEKIASAKNDGYITILINVSDQSTPVNLVQTTLYKMLNQDKVLYHESYQVTLTFKIKDIHGKYDTHYMKAVAEEIAKKSELDFVNVPRWNPNLKINKSDALYMGYPASFNMFNVTKQEYLDFRFKEKEVEK